ncbi:MAG: hypothetical protein ACJAY6_003343 [Yoonia sp.]|jgi:hypothetical protein
MAARGMAQMPRPPKLAADQIDFSALFEVCLSYTRRFILHERRHIGIEFVPIRELAHTVDKVHIAPI